MRIPGLLLVAAGLTACGSDYGSSPSGCTPSATQICMTASTFNPATFAVDSGTTVIWRNGSSETHTVTSDPGTPEPFNDTVAPSDTFTWPFDVVGTYEYHCNLHEGMTGTLTVNSL
ncbi:MAG: cupredoxin domain-containing protein [Gemmatimonadales bacterium]